MVRNAYDVPGLKILNSSDKVNSTKGVFSGSAEKATSKKGHMRESSDSLDSSK